MVEFGGLPGSDGNASSDRKVIPASPVASPAYKWDENAERGGLGEA